MLRTTQGRGTVEFRCWANDTNVWVPSGSRPSIAAVPVTGITTQ